MALRGVGPEYEAESHGRRVTKVGSEVKDGLFRVAGRARHPKKLPPEGWALNKGCDAILLVDERNDAHFP